MIVEWQSEPTQGIRKTVNGCNFFLVNVLEMAMTQLTALTAEEAS